MKRPRSLSPKRLGVRSSKKVRSSQPTRSQSVPFGPDTTTERDELESASSDEVDELQSECAEAREDPMFSRVRPVLRRIEPGGFERRELWDTLSQLAYEQSLDLARSLAHWGRRGGLCENREGNQSKKLNPNGSIPEDLQPDRLPKTKTFDPTVDTFTLWPLPIENCPKPDWKLSEELTSLVLRARREITRKEDDQDDPEGGDLDSEHDPNHILSHQIQETLIQLLISLYEFCPPSFSFATLLYNKKKRIRTKKPKLSTEMQDNQLETKVEQEDLGEPSTQAKDEEKKKGLDWRFVMDVASSTLKINPDVVQQTIQRLIKIYKIPLETDEHTTPVGTDVLLSSSLSHTRTNVDVKQWRKIKPTLTTTRT